VIRLLVTWLLNSCALYLVIKLIPGVQVDHLSTLIVATLVIGLLNSFIRPVVLLLTLPVNVLTLGLFTLVVNGLMFYLSAMLVDGFRITGFAVAFFAALFFSIFSYILNTVFGTK
jgi:putative membrane protein